MKFNNCSYEEIKYGDYTIRGLENKIAIERKSLDDYARSISGERRHKFENNIKMASQELDYYAIIVQGKYTDFEDTSKWHCKITPNCLKGTTWKWSVKYNVPIFFTEDRNHTAEAIKSLLEGYLIYNKKNLSASCYG